MIFDLIRNGISPQLIINLCSRVFILFCVLPLHEFAHAFVSYKLGDHTARLKGRLTVNPMAHIDPIGALVIVLAGFGWAKPVPVNPRNFKNPKVGMAITAAAGPLSNVIMATLTLILLNVVVGVGGYTSFNEFYFYQLSGEMNFYGAIALFLYYAASINVTLAVFNLLPVPPLDGSRLVTMIIPDKYYYKIMQYERYITIGILLLILVGALNVPLQWLSGLLMDGLMAIASFPLKFF